MATLRNVTAGIDLSATVERARSPMRRAIGWLCVSELAAPRGLWLAPCSAVHTLGMRTAIDVIFLDRRSKVVDLRSRVRTNVPWVGHRQAASIIEMGPGFIESIPIAIGDELVLIDATGSDRVGA